MGKVTVDAVAEVARADLALLGFKKRAGAIFTVDLGHEVLGWIGLNSATEGHAPGSVSVHPVVGIRHQGVERLVASLIGTPFHPYVPPTVSEPMYTLVSKDRYVNWLVNTQSPTMNDEVAQLVAAIRGFGYPWLKSNGTLEDVCRLLDEGVGISHQSAYRRPVAHHLAGHPQEAWGAFSAALDEVGDRQDPAAVHFRQFAERLRPLLRVA